MRQCLYSPVIIDASCANCRACKPFGWCYRVGSSCFPFLVACTDGPDAALERELRMSAMHMRLPDPYSARVAREQRVRRNEDDGGRGDGSWWRWTCIRAAFVLH